MLGKKARNPCGLRTLRKLIERSIPLAKADDLALFG
jgi:hypothetical protein